VAQVLVPVRKDSAVAPICNRHGVGSLSRSRNYVRAAGCKPAIQQIANLRYDRARLGWWFSASFPWRRLSNLYLIFSYDAIFHKKRRKPNPPDPFDPDDPFGPFARVDPGDPIGADRFNAKTQTQRKRYRGRCGRRKRERIWCGKEEDKMMKGKMIGAQRVAGSNST